MQIVMVLTSHSELGNTGEKTGFWLEEFAAPYYAFVDAGADVVIAAPQPGQPPVDPRSSEPENQTAATQRFENDAAAQAKLASPVTLDQIDVDTADALFFPGGHGPMWDLASSDANAKLVEAFYAQDKVISAVCHGPAALVKAQTPQGESILKGKKLTGFTNEEEKAVQLDQVVPFALETRLRELGGEFSQAALFQPHVVKDGLLVTGQNPPSSAGTAEAVVKLLNQVPA
ncbi:MAG: type 1 glutamine amidotransferase domain-containing protein [Leptolyngbya sp. SIOISBB]|nr:type 1 glutamine amidotransferase domain-containing protein [Leptolyngbya sp. SIOISBB]